MWLPPCQPLPFTVAAGASQALVGGAFICRGGIVNATSAVAGGELVVRDGSTTGAPVVMDFFSSIVTSYNLWASDSGFIVQSGLLVQAITCNWQGVLYIIPVTRHEGGWIDAFANRYDDYPNP